MIIIIIIIIMVIMTIMIILITYGRQGVPHQWIDDAVDVADPLTRQQLIMIMRMMMVIVKVLMMMMRMMMLILMMMKMMISINWPLTMLPLIMVVKNLWRPTKDAQHIRDAQNPPSHIFWKKQYDMLIPEWNGNKKSPLDLELNWFISWKSIGFWEFAYFTIQLGFHFRLEMQFPCFMSQPVFEGRS